ncbi:hypothetical protein ACFOWE_03055 [Planomonospora corallina]|uniref:Uncharacterized protein n=1 Tax=Planomonospora corallina TaxID=1806052 RepID=A0ABV8I4E3_9ACTN
MSTFMEVPPVRPWISMNADALPAEIRMLAVKPVCILREDLREGTIVGHVEGAQPTYKI